MNPLEVTLTGTWEKSVSTSKVKPADSQKTPAAKASPREEMVNTGASPLALLLLAGASSVLGALVLLRRRAKREYEVLAVGRVYVVPPRSV